MTLHTSKQIALGAAPMQRHPRGRAHIRRGAGASGNQSAYVGFWDFSESEVKFGTTLALWRKYTLLTWALLTTSRSTEKSHAKVGGIQTKGSTRLCSTTASLN